LGSRWPALKRYLDWKIVLGFFLSAVFLWVFGGITDEVIEQEYTFLDDILIGLAGRIQTPLLTSFMLAATRMGSPVLILPGGILLAAFLLYRGRVLESKFAAWTILGGAALNQVLKFSIQRSRPVPDLPLLEPWGWSYPSGHAMMSVVFYFTLGLFAVKHVRSGVAKAAAIVFFTSMPFLIAFSRFYLQVHFLSDIVAGLFAGFFWFAVCVTTTLYFKKRSENGARLNEGD